MGRLGIVIEAQTLIPLSWLTRMVHDKDLSAKPPEEEHHIYKYFYLVTYVV